MKTHVILQKKKNSSDIAEDGNTSIEEEVKCQ